MGQADKFIEMHARLGSYGRPDRALSESARADLQRKPALTAKVQATRRTRSPIYRVVEDLGEPREQCLAT